MSPAFLGKNPLIFFCTQNSTRAILTPLHRNTGRPFLELTTELIMVNQVTTKDTTKRWKSMGIISAALLLLTGVLAYSNSVTKDATTPTTVTTFENSYRRKLTVKQPAGEIEADILSSLPTQKARLMKRSSCLLYTSPSPRD